jgi:hypothetical protein
MFVHSIYLPFFQQASSDASGAQCLVVIISLVLVWIVLASLTAKTKKAEPYTRTVQTSRSREEVVKLVEGFFPKSFISSAFNWQRAWPVSDKLTLSGYYLTDSQGCLTLLITGLLPGYFLIKYAMGRTEEVAIDFSGFQDSGELTLEAKGLRAQREIDRLVGKLVGPE